MKKEWNEICLIEPIGTFRFVNQKTYWKNQVSYDLRSYERNFWIAYIAVWNSGNGVLNLWPRDTDATL